MSRELTQVGLAIRDGVAYTSAGVYYCGKGFGFD